jgi:rare lipoprotein A|tara:strand:- start:33695 stop:34651 length:957 start_codon:yes stop_codon:yes gene_type:complete
MTAALALAACSSTSSSGGKITTPSGVGGHYKVGKPYQIAGVWYYPKEDENYDHTGIGSWYGPQFHGKKTANGETFDQEQITAAHPTLPLPVLARVTNLENGRSIVVRINDRGPFVAGREIDLSRKAAELLDYERKGTARVRVQYLGRAPLPGDDGSSLLTQESFTLPKPQMDESEKRVTSVPASGIVTATALAAPIGAKVAANTATSVATIAPQATMAPIADSAPVTTSESLVRQMPVVPNSNIYVQAGSFQNFTNAEAMHQKLLAQGVQNVQVSPTMVDGTKFYRVRVGPLTDVPAADASLQSISQSGNAGARIVIE